VIRLYLIAAAAVALCGLVWYAHHEHAVAVEERAANKQLTANLEAERENRKKADESAKRYAARLAIARGPRSPPPRIMCNLPAVPRTSTAASRAHDTAATDDGGVPETVDVGPRLDVSYSACEENLIKLEELQRFLRER
jgi:hypothetical protein